MPLYEYRCRECGSRLEVLQRMGQGPDGLACTRCGAEALEKEFSTFSAAVTGGSGPACAAAAAGACAPSAGFS